MPTGTVTFLLTDIEGSSRAWDQNGERAAAAVARHYELLDVAIAHHGGARPLEQGEGDSVVAAFARASDAVEAAMDAQRALSSEPWPTAEPVRVRMAVHTGEAHLRDEGNYFGPALTRCARLRDTGHGGQILLSRATHDLICDQLADHVALLDLGSHRLRGLDRPEQVFQVCHPDLSPSFPQLRSVSAELHNLPTKLTTFVGREHEMETLIALIPASRLITLTGSGGCGKTRLALEVAGRLIDQFADGVWWVDLAAVADPGLVASAAATAVGLHETPGEPLTDVLAGMLAGRRTLIVLDNCEHLIDACAELCQGLLGRCPALVVVATSREPLGVEGETTWRVPSLAVAEEHEPVASLARCEGVRLFVDRAELARPSFRVTEDDLRTVVQICRRLDGIPLAIELAAARIRVLKLEQISAGLDDRFRLLAAGRRTALSRQRTLEASVDWSHDLLDAEQRPLLRRLSVFAGSFDLEAAEATCSAEGLEPHRVFDLLLQLVDRSLVQPVGDGERFTLLETIRQYGWKKVLDAEEAEWLRARHLSYYADLADRAAPQLELGATLPWVERLDLEIDNLRAAMDWAATSGPLEAGLRILVGGALYWEIRGHAIEARARMEDLLAQGDAEPELHARALVTLELMAFDTSDLEAVADYGERALRLARQLGSGALEARALTYLGGMMTFADPVRAVAVLTEGRDLAQRADDVHCADWAGQFLGAAHQQVGDIDTALGILDEAVTTCRASQDVYNLSGCLYWRGLCHLVSGRLAAAESDFSEGCDIAGALEDFSGRMFYAQLGLTVALGGDHHAARALIDEALRDVRETRNIFTLACGSACLAFLERATGDVEATAAAAEEAAAAFREMGVRGWLAPHALALLAWAEMRRGRPERSVELLEEAEQVAMGAHAAGWVLVTQSLVARTCGRPAESEGLARRCLTEAGPDSLVAPDALEALAGALADLGDSEVAARLQGSADALRTRQGLHRWAADTVDHEADLGTLRAELGDEAFTQAWSEGAALSADDAVALATRGRGARGRPTAGWESLTPTEVEVVRLVAQGLTNPEIGQRMFISRGTVKTHLAHVFAKLGVSTRAELATQATRRGL